MVELQPIFKKAYWTLAAGGLVYVSFICSLTWPNVQRFALYANKVNPALWQDVNQVERFGFLKTQVQPFNLVTPDNETIYGWHLLPLHLCHEHEEELNANEPSGPAEDYTRTSAFKFLANDPNARVVVNFHGNAAHLGSAQRPEIYRMLLGLSTPSNPVHVFAIDYRGFGVSTGSPSEEGLITDGVSLINFLTAGPLNISPSRIVITGQSLGTAVTAAVAERYAFGSPDPAAVQPAIQDPEPFAGVILLASFSNLRNLIESYSFKGLTPPMLSPLMGYPRVQRWIRSNIVDHWDTGARLARLTGVGPSAEEDAKAGYTSKGLDLAIIHAFNDVEIPWYEGRSVWIAATGENQKDTPGTLVYQKKEEGGPTEVKIWENRSGKDAAVKKVRWERAGYGGHNRVATFSVAALAVLRAFEE
ncbi:monoacylglycerol lipase ABHD12 [Aspergillus udagawae]|uniref:Monoacylglycerol lipase ABHD12 n=1 Tax=Aspergillus udagawae TaxID=91492 RepID=A0ABQ1A8I3_9EURO|nr:monoacylglycerol lipase ABHD12 [Aspergillus udagawae]GFF76106.1 monoacylglycerol lipase ABHD12 [Aspergillus udagawae]GFG03560.1 monoacylglycerol lipase ABHD12 [Aspergillus udagawae]GFG20223.1 monoacylglycerol lipase ABHD12 [Aspergillus udagawae]